MVKSYRLNIIGLLVCVAAFCGCANTPEVQVSARECASMPDGGRAAACATALNGKAYVFAGRDSVGRNRNDLWSYDAAGDTWTHLGITPLKKRVNACMIAYDDALYMGLGFNGKVYVDSCYLRDWWRYTPASGKWERLADYPNRNSVGAILAAKDGQIYAYYGCGHFMQQEVYRYEIAENRWDAMPATGERNPSAFGCAGAQLNGFMYFGTGFDARNLTMWHSASIGENHWQRLASLPGKGREFAVCAASNEYVYLFGGRYFGGDMTGGEVFESYMRYSPDNNQWEWCGTMPCGRAENQIAFTINGNVYFGLGEDENKHVIDKIYCIE